jgi:glyoxylase-like metal-dependent hydrolase (beta-lactamase superfamily II)
MFYWFKTGPRSPRHTRTISSSEREDPRMSSVLVRCIGAGAAILFGATGGVASSVNTLERSTSQIAEDMYVIRHPASMRGYNPDWFKRYPARMADLQKQLDERRGADGKALTSAKSAELSAQLKGRSAVQTEFGGIADRLPDMTFDHQLTLDLGGREIRLLYLGRGNTAGDVVVYLPREKIIVVGDLLDYPVPYLGGGYPTEEIDALKSMGRLDTQTIVPGHGEILHDKVYLNMVVDFLETVTGSVQKQIFRLGSGSSKLEEVRAAVLKDVDFHTWRQRFAGDDKDNREFFDTYSMPELITTAYDETWRR